MSRSESVAIHVSGTVTARRPRENRQFDDTSVDGVAIGFEGWRSGSEPYREFVQRVRKELEKKKLGVAKKHR